MSLLDITKYFVRKDLTGEDIQQVIGRAPILYSELSKYSSISKLLTKAVPYAVILYQNTKYDGHYVALFIDDKGNLNFQDSYGYAPDQPINMGMLAFDEQLPRYLTKLIDSSGMNLIVNKIDYQSKKHPNYADCGRHACLRILLRNLNNLQYSDLLMKNSRQNAFLTSDHIAVILTLPYLSDITKYYDDKGNVTQAITR
jgi:hypothetical protein